MNPVVGVFVALGLILVIWFAFVAPAERRYHARKLKILEERIERRQARLKQQQARPAAQAPSDATDTDAH